MTLMELLILAVFVQFGLAASCNCRDVDMLKELYMEARLNRMDLEDRLKRLEDERPDSTILSKSDSQISVGLQEEKFTSMQGQINALKEQVLLCQQSAQDISDMKHNQFSLIKAMETHKRHITTIDQTNGALLKAFETQKRALEQTPADNKDVMRKASSLSENMNEIIEKLENEIAANTLTTSVNRARIIVLQDDMAKVNKQTENQVIERVRQIENNTALALKQVSETNNKLEALRTSSERDLENMERKVAVKLQVLQTELSGKIGNFKADTYQNISTLRRDTGALFQEVLGYLSKPRSSLQLNIDSKQLAATVGALFGVKIPDVSGIAFTAYGSKSDEMYSSASIKFDNVLLDAGGHYNEDRGMFVCPRTGLYHFAVTLTKKRQDIDFVTAYLCVGSAQKVQLHSDPDDPGTIDFGSYSISGAATFYLEKNDWVYVRGTSAYFYDDNRSFFTGFFIG